MALVLISLAALLAEKLRREEKAAAAKAAATGYQARYSELAGRLRAEYHPRQRAFCESRAKQKAAKCTRRAGKTRGGCRETMARALEARARVLYCAATREEAKRRAWRTDTRDGWRDLVEQLGLRVAKTRDEFDRVPATDVLVNETELTIDFRNGSQVAIFAADRAEDQDKLRGGEKDIVWVDEAQIFPALTYFVEEVVEAMIAKATDEERGEVWLTGTPERNLAGLFFDVTREPEQGERVPGWEVHEWSVTDNPKYGATAEERWANTAGKTLAIKGWDPRNPPPQFVREWLGKWSTGDALYVYAVHAYPPHLYAPSRVDEATGLYDHERAARDLPTWVTNEDGKQEAITWFFALGVDFGGNPDPFAWVLWGFSPQVADIYEMGSWKRTDLTSDDMKHHLWSLWKSVGHALVSLRGDSSGALGKPTMEGWSEGVGLPIEPADRHQKSTWQVLYNGELAGHRIHYRDGSLLLVEHKELQWRITRSASGEGKRVEWADRKIRDPRSGEEVVPGNHCSDAGLYSYRDLVSRRLEFEVGPQTEAERDALQAKRMRAAAARADEPRDEFHPYYGDPADAFHDGW